MYKFGTKSTERLSTVHPDLQKLFKAAISTSPYDFSITEGVRTIERQKELVEAGKSTTMNSRHLKGNAVDIAVFVDGKLTWDFKYYKQVSEHIKATAKQNRDTEKRSIKPMNNWASLIAIINAKLPERVANNMKSPGLVYRTGRFANSTKVVNVETTRDGYASIVFDYERDPYDVFDRIKGASPWNTPQRDPRALVDKSVREIVQEMAIGRFYTRRA
jgi:peptidoglycan L-alanyl-D-glutamate endopeptidase CwlK